jgi:hypothetical protein
VTIGSILRRSPAIGNGTGVGHEDERASVGVQSQSTIQDVAGDVSGAAAGGIGVRPQPWPELQAKLRGEPSPPSQITNARVPQAPPIRVISISDRDEEE